MFVSRTGESHPVSSITLICKHNNSFLSCFQTIDRGSRGINFVLSAMVFNVVPTVFELALVSTILVSFLKFCTF
jgi:ABC-type transport system involved in Fe-S cluster assembly fused permease/ATPase subunit